MSSCHPPPELRARVRRPSKDDLIEAQPSGVVTVSVPCNGNHHLVGWSLNGPLRFLHHSPAELDALRLLRVSGDKSPSCLDAIEYVLPTTWRHRTRWATFRAAARLRNDRRQLEQPHFPLAPDVLARHQTFEFYNRLCHQTETAALAAWNACGYLPPSPTTSSEVYVAAFSPETPLYGLLRRWSEPRFFLRPGPGVHGRSGSQRCSIISLYLPLTWHDKVFLRGLSRIDDSLVMSARPHGADQMAVEAIRQRRDHSLGMEKATAHRRPDGTWGLLWH